MGSPSLTCMARTADRQLQRAAWSEFKNTLDVQGALGPVARGTVAPPGGFVAQELGYALEDGPSLGAALVDLAEDNRRRVSKANTAATPKQRERYGRRGSRPLQRERRMTGADWKRLTELATRAALDEVAA